MSDAKGPETASRSSQAPRLPGLVRVVWLIGAWLPFLFVVFIYLPQFAPIFAKLDVKHELPPLTIWLLGLWRFNAAGFGFPLLGFFAVLVFLDFRIARFTEHQKRTNSVYWTWFTAVILLALFAFLLSITALLLPVFTMSPAVE